MSFLSVSLRKEVVVTRRSAAQYGLGGPMAVPTGQVLDPLGISSVPATVWVRDGRIVAVGEGALSTATLERETEALLR